MKWVDINIRKPTKKDAVEWKVLMLHKDGSIGLFEYTNLARVVAWIPLAEIPAFTPTPVPLHGYRYVTDHNEKPSKNAQYWDTILQRWGTRAYPGTPYDKLVKYIVPIEPVYRPYANAAEFNPYRERWLTSKENPDHSAKVAAFNGEHWYIGGRPMTYQEMLNDYTFDDGAPCGIEVQ